MSLIGEVCEGDVVRFFEAIHEAQVIPHDEGDLYLASDEAEYPVLIEGRTPKGRKFVEAWEEARRVRAAKKAQELTARNMVVSLGSYGGYGANRTPGSYGRRRR